MSSMMYVILVTMLAKLVQVLVLTIALRVEFFICLTMGTVYKLAQATSTILVTEHVVAQAYVQHVQVPLQVIAQVA